jgi:hypothetical protein
MRSPVHGILIIHSNQLLSNESFSSYQVRVIVAEWLSIISIFHVIIFSSSPSIINQLNTGGTTFVQIISQVFVHLFPA